MAIFTFITHYKGGISTRQVDAPYLETACFKWAHDTPLLKDIPYIDLDTFVQDFSEAIDAYNPTSIDASVNLWLMTFMTGNKTIWTHIIKTAEPALDGEPVMDVVSKPEGNYI